MTEVRVAVKRESDGAICCPHCVALDGYDDAADLRPTVGEHDLPTKAMAEPQPGPEAVRTLGCYCEAHEVLLPAPYNAAADCDGLRDDLDEWIATPIRTLAGNPLAVPVRLADMVDGST